MSDDGAMRIQRALAQAGIASRRGAETLVSAGRVRVNGAAAQIGQIVHPATDTITVDGKAIAKAAAKIWYLLNKPAGVMTTKKDPEGRRTVFEFVPPTPGLTYVGRLDYLTEGALLLTNDGDAAHALSHPSGEVEREYEVIVTGDAVLAAKQILRGIELEDGVARARRAHAEPIGNSRLKLTLVLAEGRNREVRRMCQAMELVVERLVRTRYGAIRLGDLAAGKARVLSPREIAQVAPARR
jgi:23S rRNA pseudouridine2605 synthase